MMLDAETAPSIDEFGVLGVRPAIEPEMERFWQSAARGELVVERCDSCGLHVFPLRGICRRCLNRSMSLVVVEPPGVLYSFTINHHPWAPGMGPYALGIVDVPGLDGIRFVGLLAELTDEPEIGQLLDFGFGASDALGGLPRLHFTPWLRR
jgi:uncharacterized OB-fold protein